jgi:hypothetical protein
MGLYYFRYVVYCRKVILTDQGYMSRRGLKGSNGSVMIEEGKGGGCIELRERPFKDLDHSNIVPSPIASGTERERVLY